MIDVPFKERIFHMSCGALLLTGLEKINEWDTLWTCFFGCYLVVVAFFISWSFRRYKGE